MSEVKVNKISPRTACGTVTLGDSGDTFTIPSGATITNAGTASGFGATGETSWDTTVKTTGTFTATAGVGYFLNTTGGTITVNLPVGAAGSSVAMADYARTWQTNNVTVSPNGSEKIGGAANDATLNVEGQSVTFVYIDGIQGWVNVLDSTSNVLGATFLTASVSGACNTLTTVCTDYKLAKFLGPGTFTVCTASNTPANNVVSYMVVAGGGGGGATHGGGGGAGGFREYKSPVTPYTASPLDGNPGGTSVTVSATPYPVVVGGGGAAGPLSPDYTGSPGNPSTFGGITSTAGGGGGGGGGVGKDGGSGSGGGNYGSNCAGSGNVPSTSPAQGTDGGTGSGAGGTGGGGGATVAGTASGPTNTGGDGGDGATTSISATPTAYGGGGGGAASAGTQGCGGVGGGGDGTVTPGPGGGGNTAGTVNTGGGGGGGGSSGAGALGGSGIVYIRYKFQ